MSTWTSLTSWEPVALAVLLIVAGLIFLEHGTQKFLGLPAGDMACAGRAFDNMGAYAGVVESAAGLLIALGLFTRPAAFVASCTMAVAYWIAHAPQNFFPVNNRGYRSEARRVGKEFVIACHFRCSPYH